MPTNLSYLLKETTTLPIISNFFSEVFEAYKKSNKNTVDQEKILVQELKKLEIADVLIGAMKELSEDTLNLTDKTLQGFFNNWEYFYNTPEEIAQISKKYMQYKEKVASYSNKNAKEKQSIMTNTILRDFAAIQYQQLDSMVSCIAKIDKALPSIKQVSENYSRENMVAQLSQENGQAVGIFSTVEQLKKYTQLQDEVNINLGNAINETRTQLDETRTQLDETRTQLHETRSELYEARTQIDQLTVAANSTYADSVTPRLFPNTRNDKTLTYKRKLLSALGEKRLETALALLQEYSTTTTQESSLETSHIQELFSCENSVASSEYKFDSKIDSNSEKCTHYYSNLYKYLKKLDDSNNRLKVFREFALSKFKEYDKKDIIPTQP